MHRKFGKLDIQYVVSVLRLYLFSALYTVRLRPLQINKYHLAEETLKLSMC